MRRGAPGVAPTSGDASVATEIGHTPSRAEPHPRPVFVVGPDRSGTTLMFALLASHPNISMVRRTNMWRYFHRRYGDLRSARNLERCLRDMTRYRRMQHLHPDAERIRNEFLQGEATYGRLFALFHEHHAARAGKTRWGDKSLHTEHFAEGVFDEFPLARIVHMVRDPRDRYASVRKRHGRDLSRVGAATGRWLESTRAGLRNHARFPHRYLLARYEDLVRDPEGTMRHVCSFIDEDYSPAMLSMGGAPEHRGGNSSFGDLEPGSISPRGIARAVTVLAPSEIAFIELFARRSMAALGYERIEPALSPAQRVRFYTGTVPFQFVRMIGWIALARLQRRRGARVPPSRSVDASGATARR
jgi:hypothetical protein